MYWGVSGIAMKRASYLLCALWFFFFRKFARNRETIKSRYWYLKSGYERVLERQRFSCRFLAENVKKRSDVAISLTAYHRLRMSLTWQNLHYISRRNGSRRRQLTYLICASVHKTKCTYLSWLRYEIIRVRWIKVISDISIRRTRKLFIPSRTYVSTMEELLRRYFFFLPPSSLFARFFSMFMNKYK